MSRASMERCTYWPGCVPVHKAVLATRESEGGHDKRSSKCCGAAQASLRRLGQSSVGLYQIHWPGFPVINNWATEAFVEGLATVQQAGLAKVGTYRFCTVSRHSNLRVCVHAVRPSSKVAITFTDAYRSMPFLYVQNSVPRYIYRSKTVQCVFHSLLCALGTKQTADRQLVCYVHVCSDVVRCKELH